jgi:hypothetical protein
MATLERRGNTYRVVFRYGGQKIAKSVRTRDERAANACLARLEDNLRRLELGVLTVPDDADIAEFLLSDGRKTGSEVSRRQLRTIGQLLDQYTASISPGSMEDSTLRGMRIHVKKLKRLLGSTTLMASFGLDDLQKYVDKRALDNGLRGRKLSTATIKKELRTLNSAWTWGIDSGSLHKTLPKKGLRFPKLTEKPPFQTWQEIERKIARGGLTKAEVAALWDCLFLTLPEVEELLGFVKQSGRHPFGNR